MSVYRLPPPPLADRVRAAAAEVRPGQAAATAVAAVPYGLGWAAGKAVNGASVGVRWVMAAAKLGWTEARASGRVAR